RRLHGQRGVLGNDPRRTLGWSEPVPRSLEHDQAQGGRQRLAGGGRASPAVGLFSLQGIIGDYGNTTVPFFVSGRPLRAGGRRPPTAPVACARAAAAHGAVS